jgi:hypothetical protein
MAGSPDGTIEPDCHRQETLDLAGKRERERERERKKEEEEDLFAFNDTIESFERETERELY